MTTVQRLNLMMGVICDICAVEHCTFSLNLFPLPQDEFDNPCGGEVSGKAIVEIVNSGQQGAAAIEKPELASNSKRLTMICLKGRVTIQVGQSRDLFYLSPFSRSFLNAQLYIASSVC